MRPERRVAEEAAGSTYFVKRMYHDFETSNTHRDKKSAAMAAAHANLNQFPEKFYCPLGGASFCPSRAGFVVGTKVTGACSVNVSTLSDDNLISGFLLAACTPPPAPAPATDPIAAPLPPPKIPPRIAPATAPAPTFSAVFFPREPVFCENWSVWML